MSYLISVIGEMEGQELRFYLAMCDKIHYWTLNSSNAMCFDDNNEVIDYIDLHYKDFSRDEYIKMATISVGRVDFDEIYHYGYIDKQELIGVIEALSEKHNISLETCENEDLDDIYYNYDEANFQISFICEENSDFCLQFDILFDGTKTDLIHGLIDFSTSFNHEMYAALTYISHNEENTLQECIEAGKHFQKVLLNTAKTLKNI